MKFNSVLLMRAQRVGHRNNSVWMKTDTRKNCRLNALENLPEQSAEGTGKSESESWDGMWALH